MRAPSLKKLAAEIERRFPDLSAQVNPSWASTDRDIPGTRLRSPGKGRHGNELVVRKRASASGGPVLYRHNSAETYRNNGEVVNWIVQRVAMTVYFEVTGTPRWDDNERRYPQ